MCVKASIGNSAYPLLCTTSVDPLPAWWGARLGGLYGERQSVEGRDSVAMVEAVIFHVHCYLVPWKGPLVDRVCRQRGRSGHPQDPAPPGTGREILDAAAHRRVVWWQQPGRVFYGWIRTHKQAW